MSIALEASRQTLRLPMRRVVDGLVFVFIVCGAIAFFEPSPYDFASFVAIPVWFIVGFRVHRTFVLFAGLMFVYTLAGFIALVPYWNEPDPVVFMLQSLYLVITGLFYALYFGERAEQRAELALKAFTVSNLVAAAAAIAGYLDIGGASAVFMDFDRATGTFKDPNVLGSFLILGVLYCAQLLMLRRTRHWLLTCGVLVTLLLGIFLSFSRGSWGALVVGLSLLAFMSFATAPNARVRRHIAIGVVVSLAFAALLVVAMLSVPAIRELTEQRAQGLGAEYEDPRFFNQMRSLPMLLELPFGFGPLRFRNWFGLEPHSSYINAFASYGWLGGFSFILIVGCTAFIAFRLCFKPSPFRRLAQVYWSALFIFFGQGFQIDIDHWRHVYFMMGAVWGLETARVRWLEKSARERAAAIASR